MTTTLPHRGGFFYGHTSYLKAAKVAVGFARRNHSPFLNWLRSATSTTAEPSIVGFVRSASCLQDWLRSVQMTSRTRLGFGRRIRVKDAAGEIGFVWSSRWRRVGPIVVVGFVWSIFTHPGCVGFARLTRLTTDLRGLLAGLVGFVWSISRQPGLASVGAIETRPGIGFARRTWGCPHPRRRPQGVNYQRANR